MQDIVVGFLAGNGAIQNIPVGFIPHRVEVFNQTDGDLLNIGFPAYQKMAYTSGGLNGASLTNTIAVGHTIVGATSRAKAVVVARTITSGSDAAGTAAGDLILDSNTIVGTFASEAIYIENNSLGSVDDATGAAVTNMGSDVAAAVGSGTGISPYQGSQASNIAKGFTINATISESAKLLIWTAYRYPV